jgi:predicted HTH transcriptional regulator
MAWSDFTYLYNLIKEGEHQELDFKNRVNDASKIAKTLVAFANTKGGRLLVGVDDQGEIVGIDPDQEKHILLTAAKKYCRPAIYLHFQILNAKRSKVLEVRVKASRESHEARDEKGWLRYLRVADETVLAPGQEDLLNLGAGNPIPIIADDHPDLWKFLHSEGSINITEYMRMMNLSYQVAERSLDELYQSGVLDREEAGGRLTYYLLEED